MKRKRIYIPLSVTRTNESGCEGAYGFLYVCPFCFDEVGRQAWSGVLLLWELACV